MWAREAGPAGLSGDEDLVADDIVTRIRYKSRSDTLLLLFVPLSNDN